MSTQPTEPAEPGQKSATLTGKQAPLRPKAVPDVDPDDPPEEYAEAIGADDFVIVGKASIEKLDTGGENSDTREILDLTSEAAEAALDRFFTSKKAPGIISIGHDDIPVGRPLKEYTFEEERSIQIEDEVYEFDAGDTITTHVEDADGDSRPELWMIADLANDTDISRKARLGVLTGELDGFSVTFGRKDVEPEGAGQRVTDYDLFSVTMAPSDMIANKGSEFDLAAFKAQYSYQPTARGDDAISPSGGPAEQLAAALTTTMSETTPDDTNGLLRRMGDALRQKADEEEQTDEGQKADEEGQKQPPEGDDEGNTVEDLVRALADELDEDPDALMAALGQAADDEEEEEEDEEEDDEEAMKADEEDSGNEVNIDFGAKLEEHGVVTEEDLGEKLDGVRESIVDDLGEKLAERNKEAVEEIAQKMETTDTPHPAGGSYQDQEDFESHLDEITDGEGW